MLARMGRLVVWAPLIGLAITSADACEQPFRLETYGVEDLSLWAIERAPHSTRFDAYVTDPGGYAYRIARGDKLGKNYGAVTKITSCRVFFSDLKPDGSGGWVEVKRSIRWQGNDRCSGTKALATDIASYARNAAPPEVTRKLAELKLSDWTLFDKIDRGQFIVWTVFPLHADNFCWGPRRAGVDKLVIFHKDSKIVDVISGP
jgi:hypothetical protein